MIYSPAIGSATWVQQNAVIAPFIKANNNALGYNATFLKQLEKLDESCGYADFRKKYLKFPASGIQPPKYFNSTSDADCNVWLMAYFAAYALNPCFNVYQIMLGTCPLLSDPLGLPTDLAYSYPGLPIYFNRTDVKEAIHVPTDFSWFECVGPVFVNPDDGPEAKGDTSPDPIQSVLPRVIQATNRVLLSSGTLDMELMVAGTLLAIQNMTWGGKLGFQQKPSTEIVITLPDLVYGELFEDQGFGDIDNPQGTMGIQHYERGLMWAETFLCGHMVPQFQPRSSYRHLQWVLGHIDEL